MAKRDPTRLATTGDDLPAARRSPSAGPLQALLNRAAAANAEVGRRPLPVYDELTGPRPFTSPAPIKEAR
ncbi:hypothetical protein ACIRFH_10245 [Streptomyces sp. NPDC093586]|uniref:hypothetical protein n=1 Tax=Streptomyces sp. NPDC093586 TaxID=3366042 RepID=UPI003813AC58